MNLFGLAMSVALAGPGPQPDPEPSTAPPSQSTANSSAPVAAWPGVVPNRPKVKRSTAVGLLIGGAVATAGLTWGGGLLGATKLDDGERDLGRVLPIVGVGPFIATHRVARGSKARRGYTLLGIQQLTAIAIMTAGAVGVHRHRAYDRARGHERQLRQTTTIGMIVAGTGLTLLSYGMTAGFSSSARRLSPRGYGHRFLIPFVGGIAAAPNAPSNVAAVGALTSSALQLAGLGLAIAGSVYAMRRNRGRARVSVVPSVGRGTAALTATVRF